MDVKEQMIEAYERGYCSYDEAYDYVRERLAELADRRRKERRDDAAADDRDRGPEDA